MEVAKAELQRALRPVRGSRVEKPDLDALVQKTLGGTKAKTDGASVPNTTWEYLLRSEILSLAVRLSLSSFRVRLSRANLAFSFSFGTTVFSRK